MKSNPNKLGHGTLARAMKRNARLARTEKDDGRALQNLQNARDYKEIREEVIKQLLG